MLGLFMPWCSRLLLLRVFKDQRWALGLWTGLLCCLCCQMFRWRFFSRGISPPWGPPCQGLLGSLFPSHPPLLPAWGNPEFFLCPIISLCSCATPARAVGELCLGLSELSKVISSRESAYRGNERGKWPRRKYVRGVLRCIRG